MSFFRLALLALVCFNFYLERKIYLFVLDSAHPEHKHMVIIHTHTHTRMLGFCSFRCVSCVSVQELISVYVGVLRRVAVCVGVCVLLCVCLRYRDPMQQNLQVLQQLRETQRSLQEALQRAGEDRSLISSIFLLHGGKQRRPAAVTGTAPQ